jgi:CheY-like chemotaxis protein
MCNETSGPKPCKGIRELFSVLLGIQGGYVVTFAACGSEALDMMRTFHPDLLLLDYHLPDMTGLQLYDLLHAQEDFQPIPTIFMSATCPFSNLEKCRLIFLQKPFRMEQLRESIKQALPLFCL